MASSSRRQLVSSRPESPLIGPLTSDGTLFLAWLAGVAALTGLAGESAWSVPRRIGRGGEDYTHHNVSRTVSKHPSKQAWLGNYNKAPTLIQYLMETLSLLRNFVRCWQAAIISKTHRANYCQFDRVATEPRLVWVCSFALWLHISFNMTNPNLKPTIYRTQCSTKAAM